MAAFLECFGWELVSWHVLSKQHSCYPVGRDSFRIHLSIFPWGCPFKIRTCGYSRVMCSRRKISIRVGECTFSSWLVHLGPGLFQIVSSAKSTTPHLDYLRWDHFNHAIDALALRYPYLSHFSCVLNDGENHLSLGCFGWAHTFVHISRMFKQDAL